jgi:hypothetical protein
MNKKLSFSLNLRVPQTPHENPVGEECGPF